MKFLNFCIWLCHGNNVCESTLKSAYLCLFVFSFWVRNTQILEFLQALLHHHPTSFLLLLIIILVEGFASMEKPNFSGSTTVPSDGLNSYFMRRCVNTSLTVLAPKNLPGHECVPKPKLFWFVNDWHDQAD